MPASVRPHPNSPASAWRPKACSGDRHRFRDDWASLLAHDLKTPLATISMNLEYVLAELPPNVPAGLKEALADCVVANSGAVRIVSDMADAERLSSGELKPCITDIDARAMLARVAATAARDAARRGVRLVWTADGDSLRGDEALLTRMLDWLLERALRHARPGRAIDVSLREGTLAVRVWSAGSPEGADGQPSEPGMRALAARFAEAVARAHGGTLATSLGEDGSLRFCVTLPR